MTMPSKKTVTLILVGLCASVLLIYGAGLLKGYFESWAMEKAEAIYKDKIRTLNEKIKTGEEAFYALSEKAGKDREELRIKGEKDYANALHSLAVFKSDSAADLRRKNATISRVLAEKEKDEIALTDARISIDGLKGTLSETLSAWEASDIKKDATHKRVVDDLELKYSTCQRWTETLEKKLKRSFLDKVKDFAIPAAAFYLGTKAK